MQQGIKIYEPKEITVNTKHTECLESQPLTSLAVYEQEHYKELIKTPFGSGTVTKTKSVLKDNRKVISFLTIEIIPIFKFYGKEVDTDLIKEIAQLIFESYYYLKVDELKLFFKQLKSGRWQQMHNFSPAVLMERLAEFANDSIELRTMMGEKEQEPIKLGEVLTDEQRHGLIEIAERFAEKGKIGRDEMHEAQLKHLKEKK